MLKKEYKELLRTSRKDLIETYYGTIEAVINNYLKTRYHLEFLRDDMVSVSHESLIKAIDTYDPRKSVALETWASRIILQDIRNLVQSESIKSSSLSYIDDVDSFATDEDEEKENKHEGLLDYVEAHLTKREVELLNRGIIGTATNEELKDLGFKSKRGVRYAKKVLKDKIKEIVKCQ